MTTVGPSGASATASTAAQIREKLLRWGLFGVCFAILPIAFNALSAATRNQEVTLVVLLSRGELLLVSAAISAAAAGELFGREEVLMKSTRLFLIGMSFLTVCGSSLWFADIASVARDGKELNEQLVAYGSISVFLLSVITSGCCVILSELKR